VAKHHFSLPLRVRLSSSARGLPTAEISVRLHCRCPFRVKRSTAFLAFQASFEDQAGEGLNF
jgi:hypothetical protein